MILSYIILNCTIFYYICTKKIHKKHINQPVGTHFGPCFGGIDPHTNRGSPSKHLGDLRIMRCFPAACHVAKHIYSKRKNGLVHWSGLMIGTSLGFEIALNWWLAWSWMANIGQALDFFNTWMSWMSMFMAKLAIVGPPSLPHSRLPHQQKHRPVPGPSRCTLSGYLWFFGLGSRDIFIVTRQKA